MKESEHLLKPLTIIAYSLLKEIGHMLETVNHLEERLAHCC